MKNVSREVVLATPIPLPPLAEQSRIVARVNEIRNLCADLREKFVNSRGVMEHVSKALVSKA